MTSKPSLRELEQIIRAAGPVIDPPAAKALYAPLLADMPLGGEVLRDIVYGQDERQRLDVYLPLGEEKAAPVVVFLHGGGFIRGDKADRAAVGHYFSRHGVLAILPNYRLGPRHRWPAGAQDASAVLEWARANVAQHGGNPDHIVLAGESAGAAHVAAATLIKRFHPDEGLKIAGAFLASGVYNAELELLAREQLGIATPDPRNEAYFGTDFARYRAMSTVELVNADPFPLAITYAELDPIQMQAQAGELFSRLVTRHGFAPRVAVIRNHNHLSQVYSINSGDEALAGPLLAFVRDPTA
ncbi:alpha/beta hydrolase [Massilia sp. WF1]|uniref:alpha/beta hydrolase fold domain-containing protein n=1 Tax=unclassified Massilia TaxID=2609279 RepID=UPI00064B148E|nr:MULTISPECIES: alpha/beta hydrolase [unclassified Massilia]ALK95439.1 alpha/beta hydrolase [Massilia sp. WG5]KLU34983.1 alpha/beta hydrolase [Massilia sp. WF1]